MATFRDAADHKTLFDPLMISADPVPGLPNGLRRVNFLTWEVSMSAYEFDWVDAFADRAFGGNACAVVHGADDLDVGTRIALVKETSLSECAYIVRSDVADFGARYYLATREIPMAGHPTIATVTSLIHRGLVRPSPEGTRFTLEVGAGVLPIEVVARDGMAPLITMTQAAPRFGKTQEPGQIAAIYGLEDKDILHVPQIVSTGTPFCIAVLRNQDALARAFLDHEALQSWRSTTGEQGAAIMEPFLVTLSGATEEGDTFSRLLLPPPLPAEDPFTGSATGCMGAYVFHHGLMPRRFVAQQGHWMGRPGQAEVNVLGPAHDIAGVCVSGSGVVLMTGVLRL